MRSQFVLQPRALPPPARRWLDDPAQASFDVVVVYYGDREDFTCPQCLATYRGKGPK